MSVKHTPAPLTVNNRANINVRRSVTITIPLEVAETLQGFIDGGIGSSDDDEFTREMKIVLKKLDRQVSKHNS